MGHVSLSISMSDNSSNRTYNDILTKSFGCLRIVRLITLKVLRSHYTTLHEIRPFAMYHATINISMAEINM